MTKTTEVPVSFFDDLDEIAELAVCAAMATHTFDGTDFGEASALRSLCRTIATRLRSLQGAEPA